MKLSLLSQQAQDGLQQFTKDVFDDDLMLNGIGGLPEHWAWLVYQLKEAEDRSEWFPKGKYATIQVIEEYLYHEARACLPDGCRKRK